MLTRAVPTGAALVLFVLDRYATLSIVDGPAQEEIA